MHLSQIAWDDTILPFQLDRADIRGRVARLDGVLHAILSRHEYPEAVEALVAETALLTALIGQTIKLRWRLSLQVRGEGPVKMIASDYYAPSQEGSAAQIRAWASFDASAINPEMAPFDQIGNGVFAVQLDQGANTSPYQGVTPLAGGSLSACAETYFAQSEQLPTRFALSFGKSKLPGQSESWRAGGVMLQHMPLAAPSAGGPGGSGENGLLSAADILGDEEGQNWARANLLLDTVEDMELVGPSVQPTELLVRLFHEEAPRVFDAQPVQFGCSCSVKKVRDSLSNSSGEEIEEMTTDAEVITADYQFCGAHYALDPLQSRDAGGVGIQQD